MFMIVPLIDTPRLQLREFTTDDLDDFSSMVSDPEVMRFFGPGQVVSRQEAESALEKIIEGWQKRGFGRWAISQKESSRLIGFCGFRLLDNIPELSYMLAKAYWGLGLATESCLACLKYGFEDRRFDRIVAAVRRENVASQRVLKKIGMQYKENRRYEGTHAMYFEILRSEYHQRLLH